MLHSWHVYKDSCHFKRVMPSLTLIKNAFIILSLIVLAEPFEYIHSHVCTNVTLNSNLP